jgi:hypothetical protein
LQEFQKELDYLEVSKQSKSIIGPTGENCDPKNMVRRMQIDIERRKC